MKYYYTIPFFIPHEGCPNQCVFCNQKNITGKDIISSGDVTSTIDTYLKTINSSHAHVEVGFFGGTFTGIPKGMQEELLNSVQPYIERKAVQGIRLSTRPDYINDDKLDLLKKYNVVCIELGVQSMSDHVLKVIKRGHTAQDTVKASKLIINNGFRLVHQMMIGLPQSRWEDECLTAEMAKEAGASSVRIYPVVVIKDTELAKWWQSKEYTVLSEEEAIKRCAELIIYFEKNNIKVIRCGLHPSEGLLNKRNYLAGPFHEAFRQKVETLIFNNMFDEVFKLKDVLNVSYNSKDEAAFFGYRKMNYPKLKRILDLNKKILWKDCFNAKNDVSEGTVLVKNSSGEVIVNRSNLRL